MSAAFLSSASSTIRRASSSGGRSAAGAVVARWGRPSARGAVAGSVGVRGMAGSVTIGGPPSGLVEPMVADIGRDRIRDEIAQRSAGRGTGSQLARREAQTRAIEEGRAVREVRQMRGEESGPASG